MNVSFGSGPFSPAILDIHELALVFVFVLFSGLVLHFYAVGPRIGILMFESVGSKDMDVFFRLLVPFLFLSAIISATIE